ncbi:MAG TPA: PASTA domain-containing protein [Flavobacteriales bacterium]|nr:PASTA domain-containing protein [Flavobacteriales bacterium]
MFRFLISRTFFINLLIALALLGGLLWYSLRFLEDYTLHGQTITVPDLSGFAEEEVGAFLAERKLRYKVRNIIYDVNKPRGTVLDQDPEPESQVKENRTIYLIVNASETPKVPVPNLVDETMRRAISILETRGFKLGEIEVVHDHGNKVVGFKYNGDTISAGFKVPKGATIDLIMAGGLGMEEVQAPNVIGLGLEEAILNIKTSSLNVAPPRWDQETIITSSDTMNAIVYKQHPVHGKNLIKQGSYISLWLTMDAQRIPADSIAASDSSGVSTPE